MKKVFRLSVLLLLTLLITSGSVFAQLFERQTEFTRQDTLRGSITPERAWWDLSYYHLDIDVDIEERFLKGTNTIQFRTIEDGQRMQIDLQQPMIITEVYDADKTKLSFEREGSAFFIEFNDMLSADSLSSLIIHFEGNPKVAVRPPWDGGITWQRDQNGNPFVASANQGIGASVWWPNKDHMYDEPDSMLISVRVPDSLMNVSNGRLRTTESHDDGTKTWHWYVDNPINNYGVNFNIGDYVHFGETFDGEKGALDMDYYVLSYNLERAKEQFKDARRTMEAMEYWLGPYPFYEDGFKLVEVPYLGMEHQSSVTYGNGYQNGYRGTDLSNTGWGMKFDFIIVHEAAHEWFANNITYSDVADMWIHEGFTNYAESLFLDYFYGRKAANEYVWGLRERIQNQNPVIGIYGVNYEGSSDMYYKGSSLLHMIRTIVDDDSLWRQTLRDMNKEFYHSTVHTSEIEQFIIQKNRIRSSESI